jgi:uncharacterized 2Fe-2S/4Fe-4S cluster protein (DUF4445 family)
MSVCIVRFLPQNRSVKVKKNSTLLEAASEAEITINNLCGGDGICGRCRMIVRRGEVSADVSRRLTREEIRAGYVLACQTQIKSDLTVEIPEETFAREKIVADEDADRFRDFRDDRLNRIYTEELTPSPLVVKVYLEVRKPSLADNSADHQRVSDLIKSRVGYRSMQMGLKIIKSLPQILRENNYCITATVGLRRDVAEVMNVEGGNTAERNFMIVVDMGTTTIVAHLVNADGTRTIGARACFNSQWIYGREVTARMIAAEKKGIQVLQKLLIDDINRLINGLVKDNHIKQKDITAVVCAGNTAMGHFLLGLPTENIRRFPYVPNSTSPPPLRAAEVGIEVNPRGLLYSLPGLGGWVGSDLTAGILATGMNEEEELSMLVDIGTNGEIIIGNREYLVATSASAGPAFEGASEECGMRAEKGAIERVAVKEGAIQYDTIGGLPARGICGSGIIDLISVLLSQGIIDRSGRIIAPESERVRTAQGGMRRYLLVLPDADKGRKPIFITEADIEAVITAKAAIFAAITIMMRRLELSCEDIRNLYIAGAFGNFLNIDSAVSIGLIPALPRERIRFVGNSAIRGAKIAAFYKEAFYKVEKIRQSTTCYDLMGAPDYVEEFRKALFLPHTDIELFTGRR